MPNLNLKANNEPQKRIKEYLEQSASDVLADKINNGVPTEKDGKTLINRKTLDGFMKYATEEARKIAEKGSSYACVDDATVFGWAVHYFEEDSIIEKLYNKDGTEYQGKKPAPKKTKPAEAKKPDVKKPEQKPIVAKDKPCNTKKVITTLEHQISFFDL